MPKGRAKSDGESARDLNEAPDESGEGDGERRKRSRPVKPKSKSLNKTVNAGEQPGDKMAPPSPWKTRQAFLRTDDAVYYSARTNDPTFFYDEEDMHSQKTIRIDMLSF